MSEPLRLEYCLFCGNPTGKAGRGDGSLYIGSIGPFCDNCYGETGYAALEARITAAVDYIMGEDDPDAPGKPWAIEHILGILNPVQEHPAE